MPLFMDFHQFDHITLEDVKLSLIKDEARLKRYGVKYHQFWVNEKSATVYSLIEGPDIATCEKVYPLPNKKLEFSIDEVEAGFFKNMMGVQGFLMQDPIIQKIESPDLGNRFFLSVSLWPNSIKKYLYKHHSTPISRKAYNLIRKIIENNNSKVLNNIRGEELLCQFNDANQAISCALDIQTQLSSLNKHIHQSISFKIGLCAGKTETENYPKPSIQFANCLCRIANDNQIMVSSSASKHIQFPDNSVPKSIKIIPPSEEAFIIKVCKTSDQNLSNQYFTISKLCKIIGISRPQLYRKISAITGRSPVNFLKDLRLEKARTLLLEKSGNIAQVAMEVGYSSPSYFTKCFSEKFGYNPSYILSH